MAIVIDPSESRDRRLKMLLDTVTSAAQIQNQKQENDIRRQQLITQQQQAIENAKIDYAKIGMRPIDPVRAMSPGGNLPSKMQTGAYGQAYVPSSDLRKNSLDEFAAKSNIILQRQIALQNSNRDYKASEDAPMTGDTAGRYQFAKESLRNIPKLESMLFSGKDGAFRQDIATKLMYPWKYPKDKEVQNAKRWIIGMATARGLIQSGVVVKDNEWGRLMQQFGIDAFSDEHAIKDALSEQMDFMSGFQKSVRPLSSKDSPKLSSNMQSLYDKYAGE